MAFKLHKKLVYVFCCGISNILRDFSVTCLHDVSCSEDFLYCIASEELYDWDDSYRVRLGKCLEVILILPYM